MVRLFVTAKTLVSVLLLTALGNAAEAPVNTVISDGVLYAFLSGILIGVWRTATLVANAHRDLREGHRRMNVQEWRTNGLAKRLNAKDGLIEEPYPFEE